MAPRSTSATPATSALTHDNREDNNDRALDGDDATFWTSPSPDHGAIEVNLKKPTLIDHALTMEWLNDGQAVQRYRIQVWQNKQWQTVVSSYAIGHKKIDRFPAVTTDRVRLEILSSAGPARIREFQLFHIPDAQ